MIIFFFLSVFSLAFPSPFQKVGGSVVMSHSEVLYCERLLVSHTPISWALLYAIFSLVYTQHLPLQIRFSVEYPLQTSTGFPETELGPDSESDFEHSKHLCTEDLGMEQNKNTILNQLRLQNWDETLSIWPISAWTDIALSLVLWNIFSGNMKTWRLLPCQGFSWSLLFCSPSNPLFHSQLFIPPNQSTGPIITHSYSHARCSTLFLELSRPSTFKEQSGGNQP